MLLDQGKALRLFHMLCLDVQVLAQAWPFFGMYMEKFLKENIQPTVRLSNPALKTFAFEKIHFGHKVSLLISLDLFVFH